MLTGFTASAAAMRAGMDQQDMIASNLANANTPGYKRSAVSFSAIAAGIGATAEMPASRVRSVFPSLEVREYSAQGLLQQTGAPTHFAIEGSGYFVESAPDGERLCRAGNFQLSPSGELVTLEGNPVLGSRGPIRIAGGDWAVERDGTVKINGAAVDKLRIESEDGTVGRVIQGSLEASNVNTVQEMISMISALRAYEANQRIIQALDQTLDKAINHMGRA